jgi:uncharacterized protein YegP (UPF0339 family)
MIDYFEDEGGEWRYRVKAANGEPLVTSEGYRDETDARRGYHALERAIARQHFTPEWPQGIAHLSMPHRMVGEAGTIPGPDAEPVSRVESGPTQFGDDWPGLWLRGDSCFAYALALKAERSQSADAFSRAGVDGLITALESTNVNRERGASSA